MYKFLHSLIVRICFLIYFPQLQSRENLCVLLNAYDIELHGNRGEPIWVRTRSSHCSGPFKCNSIQHGVEVTVCRLNRRLDRNFPTALSVESKGNFLKHLPIFCSPSLDERHSNCTHSS